MRCFMRYVIFVLSLLIAVNIFSETKMIKLSINKPFICNDLKVCLLKYKRVKNDDGTDYIGFYFKIKNISGTDRDFSQYSISLKSLRKEPYISHFLDEHKRFKPALFGYTLIPGAVNEGWAVFGFPNDLKNIEMELRYYCSYDSKIFYFKFD